MTPAVLQWLAVAMTCIALIVSLAAFAARSLIIMCMRIAVAAACACVALVVLNAPTAAMGLVLTGFVFAPILLLGGLLLSARSTRVRKGGWPVFTATAAIAAGAAILLGVQNLPAGHIHGTAEGAAAWIAPLVLTAATAALGLLGYGERSPIDSRRQRNP